MRYPNHNVVFDHNMYEEVLDPEICAEQIRYIVQNDSMLLLQFLDAGPRTPRGILKGNFIDLGSYYNCLNIDKNVRNMNIEGKYCMLSVPLLQNISLPSLPEWPETPEWLPEIPWPKLNPKSSDDSSILADLQIRLAVCIPKTCSLENAIKHLLGDRELIGLEYEESYCRLPKDKPWVGADYAALVIFTVFGILLVISTAYDIRYQIFLKKDPKSVNKLYQSFSVYTNTRRLVTYNPVPGTLECLDGIRVFAMMWVIIGHTFVNQLSSAVLYNTLDVVDFIKSFWSLWIIAAPITVDTFFTISGLLLVYTTTGKMTGLKLVKNLHLFYINRYLRLFPILAAGVLLQASMFHRVSDGPNWDAIAMHTHRCRVYWWSTLLYIQNYYNPAERCLSHTWYLAIDFQLFLLSPLILFWVVSGKKRTAWIALVTGLLAALVGATIYNFIMKFKAGLVTFGPERDDQPDYMMYYYVNTLPRASPFFVGMIFGYILHLYRDKKMVLSKVNVAVLWLLAIIISSAVICCHYPVVLDDWDNQTMDNVINSYMRPLWALCISWMILACAQGYGGPVNWVLSLRTWKILGRLSYAMYILHHPLIFLVNNTLLTPIYFSTEISIQKFMTDFTIAILAAFILTIFVDAPCSALIKYFMGGGSRPPPNKLTSDNNDNAYPSNETNISTNLESINEEVPNKSNL
ncbi:nose resistant to fluoxetine protein 6-like [Aphomia sociella]